MIVYLVPIGRGRFELYSEPADEAINATSGDGFFRRQAHRIAARWRDALHASHAGGRPRSRGRIARWRDAVVRRLAETVAEQRTLWALRHEAAATAVYPANLDPVQGARF
jgi:hypothetical protein